MATLLGKEIVDKCPCGKVVGSADRQDIVLDAKENVWRRVCFKCITAGVTFGEAGTSEPGQQ